jgi:hypothetical protein
MKQTLKQQVCGLPNSGGALITWPTMLIVGAPNRLPHPHWALVCNNTQFQRRKESTTYICTPLIKKNRCSTRADMKCQLKYTSSYFIYIYTVHFNFDLARFTVWAVLLLDLPVATALTIQGFAWLFLKSLLFKEELLFSFFEKGSEGRGRIEPRYFGHTA